MREDKLELTIYLKLSYYYNNHMKQVVFAGE